MPQASSCMVLQSVSSGHVEWLYWQNEFSFPFLSIRREASVTCGTPDTGRYKQTLCKVENRHMKLCRHGGVCPRCWECKSHPATPFFALRRDVWTELTLRLHFPAVVSGSHRPGGSNYEPCWFRRPAAEAEVSTDIGSREGCGESVPSLPHHFQGIAGHGGCVWA